MTPKKMIDDLIKKGITKAEISRALNVHWQTVNNWHFNRFLPTDETNVKLMKYYRKKIK